MRGRLIILSILYIGFLSLPATAQPATFALVGGEVRTVSGPPLQRGTVIIKDDIVFAVGQDVPIPDDAEVINVNGRVVTPGLIAADTQIGLLEVGSESESNDAMVQELGPIRANLRVDDAFDIASSLIGVARRHGVTTVVSSPGGGLVSGRGAMFDLLDARGLEASQAFIKLSGMYVCLGELGASALGQSRLAAMGAFREFLDDASVYKKSPSLYKRRELYKMSAGRLDLLAAGAVLERKLPVVVEVHRASDIQAVLNLLKEAKVKGVLLGVSEGWLVAESLAQAKLPVIVDPTDNLPRRFEMRAGRLDNAAIMAEAGVRVILAARSSHNAGRLRFVIGNAVRNGFPSALALKAATREVAEAFGVEDRLGTIEQGKQANIVVWTGDPFEPANYAERVFIRGRPQPTASRQSQLAERYIEKLDLAEKDTR